MTDTPDEKSTAIDEAELAEQAELTDQAELAEQTTDGSDATDGSDGVDDADATDGVAPVVAEPAVRTRIDWAKVVAYGVLPALALIMALGAGWLKFLDNSASEAAAARVESVRVAKDSTAALLSYEPATVQQQLTDARNLLTGEFKESYTTLVTDVVIPGSQQKQISAVANVPRAASVSADRERAVVLVFVNQTVAVGADAPTSTASSVQVTLEKVGGKWLISKFEPV